MLFAFFLTLLAPSSLQAAEITKLCNVEIRSGKEIDFSQTEEKWLCGDPDSPNWQQIPIPQQRLFLTAFLQGRGFHNPVFRQEGTTLFVEAGPELEVKAFTVQSAPPEWRWQKRWGIVGETMNPKTLEEASSWSERQLQQRGYPCPLVTPQAFTDTGEIRLGVLAGLPYHFGEVETQGQSDLDPAILERFTAFRPGQLFDIRLLELTSNRILQEDLYLSTYYDVLCDRTQNVQIVRRFVPALPRLFTAGAGFDTQRGVLGRATMKWARLSKAANSLEVTLFGSFREQSLVSRFHYHFPSILSSRLKLVPQFSLRREVEDQYNTITLNLGSNLAHSWEFEDLRLAAEAGPLFERVTTIRGDGPRHVDAIRLVTKTSAMSHLFEYYLSDPREGWMVSLETSTQFAAVLSEQNVHRGVLQHQLLWNVGGWEPPFLILGWRGLLGSYFFNQRSPLPADIPTSQRFRLGGDDDIRGFSRKQLPTGPGFLTMLYQGFELRTGGWFPLELQPFLFLDVAKGGEAPRKLSHATYYAPGLGLRYNSPIGTIRASLARGFIARPTALDATTEPGLQFFFSFGREF